MLDERATTDEIGDEEQTAVWPGEAVATGPRGLFGEFWFEGDIALLFGDVGTGKSALAMQIADSLAGGKAIAPFAAPGDKRRVLYVDLEMTERQIALRYSADADPGRKIVRRYMPPDALSRVPMDVDQLMSGQNAEQTAEALGQRIENEVKRHNADVLILDSLTALKRSYYGSNEMLPVVRMLKRLARRFDLSVLVLADTSRSERTRSLTLNDLAGLRLVTNAMDSVFGIALSGEATANRYLKHFRCRTTEVVYTALHVPEFRLSKIGGNFLGFEFRRFVIERELLIDRREANERYLVACIRFHRQEGPDKSSYRELAKSFGKSKSTLQRMAQMWTEPVQASAPAQPDEPTPPPQRPPKGSRLSFPGVEEYDEEIQDPRFDVLHQHGVDNNDPDIKELRHERRALQRAKTHAREIWKKTGEAPTLYENPVYQEFLRDAEPEEIDSG